MDYREEKLQRINSYSGVVVDVTLDRVKLSDETQSLREVVHHPGGVAVLPIDEAGLVYCVRQYRYAFERHLLEIPAGKLEKGEDPFDCALRELSEETGFTAGRWTYMGCIYVSPGISTETLHLYLAQDLQAGQAHLDEGEFLDVRPMAFAELQQLVLSGEISDAKTVAAVLKAGHILQA